MNRWSLGVLLGLMVLQIERVIRGQQELQNRLDQLERLDQLVLGGFWEQPIFRRQRTESMH